MQNIHHLIAYISDSVITLVVLFPPPIRKFSNFQFSLFFLRNSQYIIFLINVMILQE